MNCWICNSFANTGEHIVKATDLKGEFGGISQNKPVYFNGLGLKNNQIGSFKNNKFKSPALICARCNNNLTQPFDRAWEALHTFIKENQKQLFKAGYINLSNVFSGIESQSMLHVHLYFAKLFGCRIVADNISIDISLFSKSLRERRPHPYLYLCIGKTNGYGGNKISGITPNSAVSLKSETIFASWMYIVGSVSVNVIFSKVGVRGKKISNPWHPKYRNNSFKLARYRT